MSDTERNSGYLTFNQLTGKSIEILWKIPEYLSLRTSCVISLPFIFENAAWNLSLYPFYGNVKLNRLHSLVSHQTVLCKISTVLENECDYGYERYFLFYFGEKSFGICHSSIPRISTVRKDPKKFLQDGTFVLVCHLLSEESVVEMNERRKDSSIYSHDVQKKSNFVILKTSSVQCVKVMWELPEFFSLPYTIHSVSPSFTFDCAKWFLKLHPNNSSTEVSVSRSCSFVPSHEVICTVNLMSEENIYNVAYNRYKKILFGEKHEDPVFSFPNRSKMYYQRRVASGSKITFFCHIFFEESTEATGMKDQLIQKMSLELNSYRTLCQDFKKLFLNGEDCDLTLKVKSREFRVHRNILKARSHVFMIMLTHDMAEKNSGVIDILDCDADAMEQLLLYLYSGDVDNINKNNMLEIYYAADKYDLQSLKEECCNFIKKSFIPNNVCDIIQLAMNHNDKDLLESATKFFINNREKIIVTAEWKTFVKENNIVAKELLASIKPCCD